MPYFCYKLFLFVGLYLSLIRSLYKVILGQYKGRMLMWNRAERFAKMASSRIYTCTTNE
jgi:hypothetical protein